MCSLRREVRVIESFSAATTKATSPASSSAAKRGTSPGLRLRLLERELHLVDDGDRRTLDKCRCEFPLRERILRRLRRSIVGRGNDLDILDQPVSVDD